MTAAQVTISLLDDGQLQLKAAGPAAGNKLLLIGMLETAKTSLLAPQEPRPATPPILLAQRALPNGG